MGTGLKTLWCGAKHYQIIPHYSVVKCLLNKCKALLFKTLYINNTYHWKVTNITVSSLSIEEKVVTLRRLQTKSNYNV